MGQYVVTTFGKWEMQRIELVKDLLLDPTIAPQTSIEAINNALLDPVNSAMYETARGYVSERMKGLSEPLSSKDIKALTVESYKSALSVVLESLSSSLSIPASLLAPHVLKFCDSAMGIIDGIIDDVMKIGQLAIATKNEAIDQLYGPGFRTQYPLLAKQLLVQDEELSEKASKIIELQINPEQFAENEVVIRESLKYINEISAQTKPSPTFQEEFKQATGSNLQEFKQKIRDKAIRDKLTIFGGDVAQQPGEVTAGLSTLQIKPFG